jgi:Reverse transcriptase (RNA-dependent DNA polymerase)
MFHPDSYGYRPKRSELDAVGECRRRCWKTDWVLDLDIQKFFDTVDHALMVKAVRANTDRDWVVLYVQRCDRGLICDRTLGTGLPDVWAAGDVVHSRTSCSTG